MKYIFILIIMFVNASTCRADEKEDWEEVCARYADLMGDNTDDIENIYDVLYELYLNPIDINKASREDLEQLPFLNDSQIEAICAYLYFYDGMKSLGELALIEQLDYYTRRLLVEFIYVGEMENKKYPSLRNIAKYGKHDIMLSCSMPLYERKGDKGAYLGDKYRHSLRYNFKYGNYLRFGFTGSKDSGEPFFKGDNVTGYDYYSFFAIAKDIGRIKSAAIGRYRLSFGMGLVMNNNFSLGKTSNISLAGRTSNNITAHSSCNDGSSLQGAAATINVLKNTDVTAFVSYKKLDATTDKYENIKSLYTSGYHRTETEMKKKRNTEEFVTGASILWRAKGFHAGISGYYAWFNRSFAKAKSDSYRAFGPQGNTFYNIGINYGYICHKFAVSGETAIDKGNSIATINSISYNLSDRLKLKAVQRFYSYRYFSLFSQALSDGGHVQNESGCYAGADFRVTPNLMISGYADIAYFPFKKYNTSSSSYSSDYLINAVYNKNDFSFGIRHRYRDREKNLPGGGRQSHCYENQTRIEGGFANGRNSVKLQWNGHHCRHKENSFGWMASCYGGIGIGKRLKTSGLLGYFSTKDYASRIYIYERGPMYSFSFPSFYGRGIRFSSIMRYDINKKLMILMRYGITKYFDRDKISSGLREIDKSYISDIDLQIRFKF